MPNPASVPGGPPSALAGFRVLEIANMIAGPYCGKLLASLGAEVVKVETPAEGDPSRRRGPFPEDVPHPERSGTFLYLNTGKKSLTLNLEDPQGRVILAALMPEVDGLVHDLRPAQAGPVGLDPESLRQTNPHLVVTALTPYGSTGPYADYRGYDVNVFHAGGEGKLLPNGLALEYYPERAPLVAGSNMASYQGGLTAAVGTVAALYSAKYAAKIGRGGQYLDCSMQQAQLAVGYIPIQRLESEGVVEDRFSRFFRIGGVMPAQDGYVELLTLEPRQWQGLIEFLGHPEWAREEHFSDPATYGPELNRRLREWFSEHPKDWLYRQGQAHGVPVAPYYTPAEVFASSQQRERQFFRTVGHPEAGEVEYPGLPFHFSETPEEMRRAPLLGEHNSEILATIGYNQRDLVDLARAGVI
ncbi:MAG: CoA transferase [Chloroflexi bacterium]|nr:CoA transferase [Chloroflexota bacterium]